MIIRRLDVFFRTQITLDTPSTFNTLTNLALAPLQHLVGQNQFKSLKGKVSTVAQTAAVPPRYFATLRKVIVVVCAFFLAIVLTPFGIATRHLSFRSPQVDRAYSHAFFLQLNPLECTSDEMVSSSAFIQKMTVADRTELLSALPQDLALSFLSLPAHRDSTHAFLSQCHDIERTGILKKLPPSVQGAFLSLDVNAKFSKGYIQQVTESEYTQLMPHLPINLMDIYQAQKTEKEKKQSLDTYLTAAIQSLENLDARLKSKGTQEPWITQFRNDPLYPFPFYLAQQLESTTNVVARADKTLWGRLLSLRQSCLAFLSPDSDNVLLRNTQAQANATLAATFKPNVAFFKALREKLESDMETSEIKEWVEQQKRAYNYSYPFHTQPGVLKLLGLTIPAEKLQPLSETVSTCS
ncbi:MAG TPA: hypothetical protein VIJ14_01395, partial [Rhabdochlamydiaceae bacterium]